MVSNWRCGAVGAMGKHCSQCGIFLVVLQSPKTLTMNENPALCWVLVKEIQTSLSLTSLDILRMQFSYFLPKAMFLCYWCHQKVASFDCCEGHALNLSCQNLVQINGSLVMVIPERGGKGIGCDTTDKPDGLGEHCWETAETGQNERRHLPDLYTQLQSRSIPLKYHSCRAEISNSFSGFWVRGAPWFSNEHKSKQNKMIKFLEYLLRAFLTSRLIYLLFKFTQRFCLLITNFSDYFFGSNDLMILIVL